MRAGKTFIKGFMDMIERTQEKIVVVVVNEKTFTAMKPHFEMVECMYQYEHSMYRILLHDCVVYLMVTEEGTKDFEAKVVDMSKKVEPKIIPFSSFGSGSFGYRPELTYGIPKLNL